MTFYVYGEGTLKNKKSHKREKRPKKFTYPTGKWRKRLKTNQILA